MKAKDVYLICYNVCQSVGWSVVLTRCVQGLINGLSSKDIFTTCYTPLAIAQTAALLEVVHCAIGFVRSPVATTAMQVASRLIILWPITVKVESSQDSIGVPLYLLAWSITECIRYPYYACSIVGRVPHVLTLLRYTLFIGLYPLGVVGELLTLYAAMPAVRAQHIYSYPLPNRANISFDYNYALMLFAGAYVPFFPQLYMYMFTQRAKVLGPTPKLAKD